MNTRAKYLELHCKTKMKIGIQEEQNTWNCTVTTKMKIGIQEQNTWNCTVTYQIL
jgi:hypothetical protein